MLLLNLGCQIVMQPTIIVFDTERSNFLRHTFNVLRLSAFQSVCDFLILN